MSNYRRPRVPGATVFLTLCLAERGSDLLVRQIGALRGAVREALIVQPFRIDAWVVLPDHMHCVWTLPEGDADFSGRVGRIKAAFSKSMPDVPLRASHVRRRERGIWQRRFWEHHVRDEAEFVAAFRYCWENPVKHGLVREVREWPFSSWHRDHPADTR